MADALGDSCATGGSSTDESYDPSRRWEKAEIQDEVLCHLWAWPSAQTLHCQGTHQAALKAGGTVAAPPCFTHEL